METKSKHYVKAVIDHIDDHWYVTCGLFWGGHYVPLQGLRLPVIGDTEEDAMLSSEAQSLLDHYATKFRELLGGPIDTRIEWAM